jgi:hypothetical protein
MRWRLKGLYVPADLVGSAQQQDTLIKKKIKFSLYHRKFRVHCKSGPHKIGIRKSSRKTYDNIMGIFRFEAEIVIIKKEMLISFFKYITAW